MLLITFSVAGPTVDSTMTLSVLSSRDANPTIELSLTFKVSFGPPSRIICTRDSNVVLNINSQVTYEVIRSRYISSTLPDMTRVIIKLDPQPKVGGAYNCTVTVESRVNIASNNYDFDAKGSGSSTVTVTGE